jgi:hypothetical protein
MTRGGRDIALEQNYFIHYVGGGGVVFSCVGLLYRCLGRPYLSMEII